MGSLHRDHDPYRAEPTIEQPSYQCRRLVGRNGFVVVIVELAPAEPPSAEHDSGVQAWQEDYPWLHRAFKEVGPGARAARDAWRIRIEDELKTTLDFRVRADGTAAVWCGMSGYEFHHNPTPKELFEGLADAYRRERKRVGGSHPWKMSAGALLVPPGTRRPLPPVRPLSPPAADSIVRALSGVLLPRAEQFVLIFLAVTTLTLVLATVAILVVH